MLRKAAISVEMTVKAICASMPAFSPEKTGSLAIITEMMLPEYEIRESQIKYERVIITAGPNLPARADCARFFNSAGERYSDLFVKIHSFRSKAVKILQAFLIRIFIVFVSYPGSGGSAGNISSAALGTDGGVDGNGSL